jgi:hypothetical protein
LLHIYIKRGKLFMTEPFSQALPWFGHQNTKVTSTETTPGHTEATPWVVVALNLSPAEAVIIKGRLESEAIPAIVQQEAMGIMLGLTVGPMGSAKVLVPEPVAEKALQILAETFEIGEEDE